MIKLRCGIILLFLGFVIGQLTFAHEGYAKISVNIKTPIVVSSFLAGVAEDHQLDSALMARKMPYRVILPNDYKKKKKESFPVIYFLHGLSGHFDNWTNKTKIAQYLSEERFIAVFVEGGDGWYTDSVSTPNDLYESYIIQELIPQIDKNFRTLKEKTGRAIAGLSMGGYGAIKFGLKYPELFSIVGSFSGALDAPLRGQDNAYLRPSILSVFGQNGSPAREDNDIFRMAKDMSPEQIKELPFIYHDCGTEDRLIQTNRDFAGVLLEEKIPHEFRELPGQHNWIYWDRQVQEFIRISRRLYPPAVNVAASGKSF